MEKEQEDDTMVTRVAVTILDDEGQPVEQGEAELTMGIWWEYQATNKGQIQVRAWDMAGNLTRQEFRPQYPFLSVWEKPIGVKNQAIERSGF